ncbi:MAG: vWA domain-containing protein [bacterium]
MKDNSIRIMLLSLIILGVFLGAYEGLWRQGAKKVANYNIKLTQTQENINILVIWDASDSMWEEGYGIEKIIQSKDVLETFVNNIPEEINVGLRISGSRRIDDLGDSFLATPIKNGNKENMLNFITNVKPVGKASIAHSLDEARKDLHSVKGKKFMLLVSDGIDKGEITTDEVIKNIIKENITLHIVHIGEGDNELKDKLKNMAAKTGGFYYSYNEQEEVIKTFIQ